MAFDKIIASLDEILGLIPQKPPVVMIDRLLYIDKEKTVAGLLIREDNVFCFDGKFREAGLIESIAQTAAVSVGYQYNKAGKKAPVGYIGSINRLQIHILPAVNTLLTIEIINEYEVLDFSIIRGKVYDNDTIFAECEMKIFLKKEGIEV
jgi:predicted hotdog family 3-hydroxylacyl-ACP dehydratase